MMGLSPRVRGNLCQQARIVALPRSIPACAGEPRCDYLHPGDVSVYPRVCGGTRPHRRLRARLHGLSPRVRGNPKPSARSSCWPGSIHACAGEPPTCLPLRRIHWVYPRVCGGTTSHRPHQTTQCCLSPRVRGNHQCDRIGHTWGSSIPACAGEPPFHVSAHGAYGVYPRVCGGTAATLLKFLVSDGLSPRVRGNR